MSKPNALFSYTPVKNMKSSPATNRSNSANKMMKSQPSTPTVSDSSPRKCRIETEIQRNPMRGGNINIKSKVQLGCKMSPKVTHDVRMTKASPRKENLNEARSVSKQQQTGAKVHKVTGVRLQDRREETATEAKQRSVEPDSTSSEEPAKISVKSMRSCFEHKENKVPCRPPPSPSPSRARSRVPVTPRNTNPSIKGILSSRSRYDKSPTPQLRSTNNSPTPQRSGLRRSVSTGTLLQANDSPRRVNLTRSSSQTLTPKHRVKFQDEVTPKCFSPVLLETKGDHISGESITGEVTNLSVGVRVRPPLPGERSVVSVDGNTIKVKALGTEHCFSYDYCFTSTGNNAATQEDVFKTMVEPLVNEAFQGYNVCLFAYGQTGSGKSYSMMGEDEVFMSYSVPKSAGIIPRFSRRIFQTIEGSEEYSQTKVEISYFEIYNEKIHDLLGPSQNGRGVPLRVREHPELGPYVVDLTVHTVPSLETLQDWLRVGNSHKVTAATEMNQNSSRSHAIFTVTLTQSQVEDRPSLCSKINLIDLAGSERLALTCATGDRLKEGVSINRSLLTLGKVISSLAENKKRGFIPYRESVLTWLLRESLGGNSHTAMLATISPSGYYMDETLSTLRYACQARNIINTVRINESLHEKRIRELLEEIQSLKNDNYKVDHAECQEKIQILQNKLDETSEDLSRANTLFSSTEVELEKLRHQLVELQEINIRDECERRKLERDLMGSVKCKTTCNIEIKELKQDLLHATEKNYRHEKEIKEMKQHIEDLNKIHNSNQKEMYDLETEVDKYKRFNRELKSKIYSLEKEIDEYKNSNRELKSDINKLNKELIDCKINNSNYEKDISDMKRLMLEIKNNSNHDHCDNQITMLQTELAESEKITLCYREKITSLENKCAETKNITNHDGCEKEISTLKQTISDLKLSSDHGKCDTVIEKLKTALTEAETFVTNLTCNVSKLQDEKKILMSEKEQNQKAILSLNTKLLEIENKNNHNECEERIDTLRKALAVSKSMNIHVQCENRISELEMELRNMQSVTLADHSKCDEKINDLFYAVEKYADENCKLVEHHKKEISQYKQTIHNLESQVSKATDVRTKAQDTNDWYNKDLTYLETQTKLLKEENTKMKKKKVDDDKKISSLEKQVISLTKELLEVKNQLRNSIREKELSDSLCAQLKEQMIQQDRKLAEAKDSSHLFDDKENWETPSKVIRRSIARHSNNNKDNERCSLVMKADEMHQALKDAEDICSRLKIPWVFQLEPEVTTHSWFDVNVRVWDQRNMSSVRWPREVFLGWLRDMKEEIMSKSRGHKLFHAASWLQNNKDAELLSGGSENFKKERALRVEIQCLHSQITTLQNLCEKEKRQEVLPAVTALGKSVSQLSSLLGLCSPLQHSNTNRKP